MKNGRDFAITCTQCNHVAPSSLAVTKRKVDGYRGALEYGVSCPECSHWTHIYFENPKMRRLQNQIKRLREGNSSKRKYDRARKQLDNYHQKHNEEMRNNLGVSRD